MYNSDTELLFPLRVIPELRNLRGPVWRDLIDMVSADGADPLDQMAVVLMMVRLGGCIPCNADSFRAMRGCTQCARQTIRRYKGSDEDLVTQFQNARREVKNYQQKAAS
jgi:hypothetical protein